MNETYKVDSNGWHSYKYPHPAVAADCVIFCYDDSDTYKTNGENDEERPQLEVLLIKRGLEPYKDCWALPGGFMDVFADHTIEETARRELAEETCVSNVKVLKQLPVRSDINRDNRNNDRVLSVPFYTLIKKDEATIVHGGTDAAEACWFRLNELPTLAFDHAEILKSAEESLRQDIVFEPVGFELLGEIFTLPQLYRLYSTILNRQFDRRNFCRKMKDQGILIELNREELTDEQLELVPHSSRRTPSIWAFNREAYNELKSTGKLKMEF